MNRPKPVREAAIDVVQEARQVCSKVAEWIERLNDILLSGCSILRSGRQRTHVSTEVLNPIVNILVRKTSVRVPLNPPSDVIGKSLVEFGKIVGDNESVVPDIVSIDVLERIASVPLFGVRGLLRSPSGQSAHVSGCAVEGAGIVNQLFHTDEAFRVARIPLSS